VIRIEGRAVTYGELWFDEEPGDLDGVDVLIYRHRPAALAQNVCRLSLTLVSDLGVGELEIFESFGSTTRYEVRRADKADGLRADIAMPSAVTELEAFYAFYDAFAEAKRLEGAYRRGLQAAANARQLVLTTASSGDIVLTWHAYIVWEHSAALLHSASHFREKSTSERALVGRANRWLHWRDMIHFKRHGLRTYDWGGIFQDENAPERAGINKFKQDFGGRRHTTYDCTVAATARGRVYLAARKFLDSATRRSGA
jgi:hypothetical protein